MRGDRKISGAESQKREEERRRCACHTVSILAWTCYCNLALALEVIPSAFSTGSLLCIEYRFLMESRGLSDDWHASAGDWRLSG